MNLALLLALLTFTLTDPTGDAIGDGTLGPPTAPIYANAAMFDLQAVELEVKESGAAVLRVTLGALGAAGASDTAAGGAGAGAEGADAPADAEPESTPGTAPAGTAPVDEEAARQAEMESFDVATLLAVVDVYLDSGAGGATETLSGPDMLLPLGSGWRHAVRISAEGAWGITYTGEPEAPAGTATDAPVTVPAGPGAEAAPAGAGARPSTEGEPEGAGASEDAPGPVAAEQDPLTRVPLAVNRRGNVLELALPWTFDPEAEIDLYAMSGIHDPFSPSGWRALSPLPSPWAFSGEQVTPVIDLLAVDADAQAEALRRGVLPAPAREPGMSLPLSPWLWLMVGGLALALLGLVLRGRVAAPGAQPEVGVEEGEGVEDAEDEVDAEVGAGLVDADEERDGDVGDDDTVVAAEVVEDAAMDDPPMDDAPVDDAAVAGADVDGSLAPVVQIADVAVDDAPGGEVSVAGEVVSDADAIDPHAIEPAPEEPVTGEAPEPDGVRVEDDALEVEALEDGALADDALVDDVLVVEDAQPAATGPESAQPAAAAGGATGRADRDPRRSGYSTRVEESYLMADDELVAGAADEDGESFWHPGTRGRSTLSGTAGPGAPASDPAAPGSAQAPDVKKAD